MSPNVLMIYTDDHRASGVGAFGGTQVQTPNIDQLASQGVVFKKTYLMGSFLGATCIPSRAMLLTGRNLFELERAGRTIPMEHTTISEAFHSAGYQTHIVGKWHQDHTSVARCFESGDSLMGLSAYLVDHFRMPLWDWNPQGKYPPNAAYLLESDSSGHVRRRPFGKSEKRGPIGTEKTGPHTSEIFADSAAEFIRAHDGSRPFFLYLAFHAPHDPRQAPQKYRMMYPPGEIRLPPSYMPQHPFDNGHMVLRDEALATWPRTVEIARKELADYYATITHLDAQIGRVVAALRESGMYDNTLIVLAGDSGLAVGCHGLMGKQNVYDEDGLHVPFLVSGAVKSKLRSTEALCYTHDISPTVCELAGVPVPASFTGKSLAPVLQGQVDQIRDHTYHAYRQHQRALRKDGFKLIEYVRAPDSDKQRGNFVSGSRVTQLFNLKNDPWETTDIAFHPEHAERVRAMQKELQEQAAILGDSEANTGHSVDFWMYRPKE